MAKQNLDFFRIPLVVVHGTMPVDSDDSWLFPRYLQRNVNPFALLASDAATAIPRLDEIVLEVTRVVPLLHVVPTLERALAT